MVDNIIENGSKEQIKNAVKTLTVSDQMRSARMAFPESVKNRRSHRDKSTG
ncbi:MAG: hypothetical protein HC819_09805 [Cyclobacteriaceae bacterium]|nr:hypothetical protein [Cyclobacteriaceae bacterium]